MKPAQACLAIALASTVLASTAALAADFPAAHGAEASAAHAIADKFAAAEAQAARAEAARRAAELAERRLRRQQYRAVVARRMAERRRIEQAEAERRRSEQMKADEAEMLARARAEAERMAANDAAERAAAAKSREIATQATPGPAVPPRPEVPAIDTLAAERMSDPEGSRESRQALEARRRAESDAIAQKLNRFRNRLAATRPSRPKIGLAAAPDGPVEPAEPDPAAAEARPRQAPQVTARAGLLGAAGAGTERRTASPRATVLLVIEHGRRGIRRFDATGDPILCLEQTCFVGAGPDTPALRMTRGRAFGPGNTLGARAGACSHSLTCILRDVDLGSDAAVIQPIDLRLVHHDRREPAEVRGDSDCSLDAGRLSCRFSVRGSDWRAWIVPERLAAMAGPVALKAALDGGLGDTRTAANRR